MTSHLQAKLAVPVFVVWLPRNSVDPECMLGFIWNSQLIQSVPQNLRAKAAKLISGKASLMARVDAYGRDPEVVLSASR